MKMIMIAYNSAIDGEVNEAFAKCGIQGYTKWTRVFGKGTISGPHMGTDIWPGENAVIFTAIENEKLEDLLNSIKDLRAKLGKAGVKAFVWNLEEIT